MISYTLPFAFSHSNMFYVIQSLDILIYYYNIVLANSDLDAVAEWKTGHCRSVTEVRGQRMGISLNGLTVLAKPSSKSAAHVSYIAYYADSEVRHQCSR